ncbi:MAG: helix-turn-helix domain-containing protein [SAR202 cluster bacterium]|nr:hypothetical protein [Chloroflexota bacterium]MQG87565.1 helix-turn-helix domain-containing protein [SAR202 cluster bacterium]|tara:strand:+ start:6739 stop:7626 length:888 start_codon:yes stop_codon:yes gene_type:complete
MSQKFSVRPRKTDLEKHRQNLLMALIEGDSVGATRLVDDVVSKRWEPSYVYVHLVGHCLAEIGMRWHSGDLKIAVEHRATQIALRLLSHAQSFYLNGKSIGRKAVVTSVEGDRHAIGGLSFADLLRFDGWDVHFLGADSPVNTVVEMVSDELPDLVGLSVNIEALVPKAVDTIQALKNLQKPPAVVVGGYASYVDSITGADFHGADALGAIQWVRKHFDLDSSSVPIEVLLEELGQRIQVLRKDKGLSQQGLATAAGLDRSYISAVEHGKQNVSFATLKGIGDALDVSVGDLVAG